MMSPIKIKENLLQQMHSALEEKQNALRVDIRELKTAMENETKSSAGDKFETGREMMQAELQKAENQYRINQQREAQLNRLDPTISTTEIQFGCLVQTSVGNYFISLPLGKFVVEDRDWVTLSLASPLGKMLMGKRSGQLLKFRGKGLQVVKIV